MNEVQRQEEVGRQYALRDFEDSLWLSDETLEALMVWVGMNPEDLTHPSFIRAAVHATTATARHYKTNRRHTVFARAMRLRYRLGAQGPKYRRPSLINASSMRKVVNRQKFINLTIMHVPEPRTYNRRNRDMRACGEFLDKVAAKFLATHFFGHELLKPQMFAVLGLLPDELVAAERSYERLVRLVQAAKLRPNRVHVGFAAQQYATHKRYTNRKRRDRLCFRSFVAITHAMKFGHGNARDIATKLGVEWTEEDQDRMIKLGWQLRHHMFRYYVELPQGYRYK